MAFRTVQFSCGQVESSYGEEELAAGRLVSIDNFCEIITNRQRGQLRLSVSEAGVSYEGSQAPGDTFVLDTPSISLAELITSVKLSQRMRLLLSFYLASSVWAFYSTDWMRSGWTKDTVHFMFERRSGVPKEIYVNEPYLSATFTALEEKAQGLTENFGFRSHIFPKILALGIMLIKIELGLKIEDYRDRDSLGPKGDPTVNTDHITATRLLNTPDLWEKMDTFGAFRQVVGICLSQDSFLGFVNDPSGLRDSIDKKIVYPLREMYKYAWLVDPDLSSVPHVQLDTLENSQTPGGSTLLPHTLNSTRPPIQALR